MDAEVTSSDIHEFPELGCVPVWTLNASRKKSVLSPRLIHTVYKRGSSVPGSGRFGSANLSQILAVFAEHCQSSHVVARLSYKKGFNGVDVDSTE